MILLNILAAGLAIVVIAILQLEISQIIRKKLNKL